MNFRIRCFCLIATENSLGRGWQAECAAASESHCPDQSSAAVRELPAERQRVLQASGLALASGLVQSSGLVLTLPSSRETVGSTLMPQVGQ